MKIYVAEFKGRPALSRYTVVKETAKIFTVRRDGERILGGPVRVNKQVHKEYCACFDSYDDAIKWLIAQAREKVLVLEVNIRTTKASISDLERRLDRSAD